MALTTTIKLDLSAFSASLQEVGKKAVATAADIQQAFAKNAKIDVDTNPIINEMKKVEKTAEQTASGISKIKGAFSNMLQMAGGFSLAGGIQAGVGAVTDSVKKAINTGIDFEKSLADMSAITGVTGKDLDGFGDKARNLAKQFGGSAAEQIASFKGVLSRLGPDIAKSPEALNSMTESINTLAKAGGITAAESMDALTTGMLQFGVSMDDPKKAAGEMSRMMNVMAAGAKEGAAEVPQINQALVVSGAMAKSANVSFEELNAGIQVLATRGKTGAEAGTALRNVMIKLSEGRFMPKDTMDSLKSAGVDVAALSDKSLSLQQRLEVLKPVMQDDALIAKMFGAENVVAGKALLEQTDALGTFTEKMTGTKTASEQAAINMNTFAEAMARFKANIEDVGLGLFKAIAQPMQDAFKVIGDSVLPLIQSIFTSLAGPLSSVFKLIGDVVKLLAPIITSLLTAMAPIIDMVIKFADSLITALMPAVKPITEIIGTLGRILGAILKPVLDMIIPLFPALMSAIVPILQIISDLLRILEPLIPVILMPLFALLQTGITVIQVVATVLGAVLQVVSAVINVFADLVTWIARVVKQWWETSAAGKFFQGIIKGIQDAIQSVVKWISDFGKSIGDMINKVGEFFGLVDKKDNKAPLKKTVILETKQTVDPLVAVANSIDPNNPETKKAIEEKEKELKEKNANKSSKPKEDPNIKYQQEMNAEIAKGKQDINKKELEENLQLLQQKKDNILNDTKITEQERLKAVLAAEQDIELQKLDIALLGLEQRYKAELAQEEKKFQDLKKAGKISEESERLHRERIKQIDAEYEADFMKEVAKNDTAINKAKVENAKKTQDAIRKGEEESKKLREQEAKDEDEFIQQGIKRKFKGEEQKYQLALYALQKEYRAGTISEEEYLTRKLEMYKEYLYQTNTLYRMSQDFKDAVREAFSQKEDKKATSALKDEIKGYDDQEKALKESLNKRQITKKEYAEKFKEIEKQRQEKEEQLEEKSFSFKKNLLKSFQLLFEKTLKDRAVAENVAEKKHAAMMADQTATDEQRFKASADLLKEYSQTAAVQLGEVLASGKATLGDVLVVVIDAAAKMLTAMIPVWIAGIMGTTTSQMGIWGLVVAGGLIALVTGLAAVAKSSLSSAKGASKGYLPGVQGYTEPADIDTELVRKSPREAILDEQMTAENRDVLDFMFKTKKTAREYFGMSIKPADIDTELARKSPNEAIPDEQKTAREYFGMSIKPQDVAAAPQINNGGGESVGAETAREYFGMSIKPQYIVATPKVNAGRGESVGAEIARALAGMNGERNSRIGVELDINGRLTNTGDIMVFAERQRAKNLKTF